MAAAQVARNAYLRNTLRIPLAVVTALNAQGIQAIDDFLDYTETDINNICRNCRRPGGLVPGANIAAPQVPNPGVTIGHAVVKRLKQFRFYRHHLVRVQRAWVPAGATLARLREVARRQEIEEAEGEETPLPEKFSNVNNVREVLENIQEYLRHKRGVTGIPLAYVTRETVALPLAAADPGFGLPDYDEEMIRRAPHDGPVYAQDNVTVWQVIRHVTHEGPGWNWVVPFAQDGRGAYLALHAHYMGDAFQERIRARADALLSRTYYDGR